MKKSIVIDREYGSGGREVAKILSEKTGMPFYDGNMLELASRQYGIDLGVMKNFDEKYVGSFLHDLTLLSDAFTGENAHAMPFRVYEALARLIKRLAMEQPCIFLGRCADEILKDSAPFLHIFVYSSDVQKRKNRVMEVDGISVSEVSAAIRKKDAQRRNYCRYFSKKDWDSMKSYHMCIDTAMIDYEAAADAIIEALGE